MKGILRDYLIELVSGFFNIALLLLDFLGIVLLFWPGFLWAQVTGLLILALSFGIANFRIYRRQRQLLSSRESQVEKRVYLLRSLLGEIQANLVSAKSENVMELSDDVWQHSRDNIYWLPTELQEQLSTHYRALHLLLSIIRDGINSGWLAEYEGTSVFSTWSTEVQIWLDHLWTLNQSFSESTQELPQILQEQIGLLEKDKGQQ